MQGVLASSRNFDLSTERVKLEIELRDMQRQIEAIARCILPDILAFYESEEGTVKSYAQKQQRHL